MKKVLDLLFGLYGRVIAAVMTVFILCNTLGVPVSYAYMTAFFAFIGFVGTMALVQILQRFLLTWKVGYLIIGGGITAFITYFCIKVIVISAGIEPSPLSPYPERVTADWSAMLIGLWYNVLAAVYYKCTELILPPRPDGKTLGY